METLTVRARLAVRLAVLLLAVSAGTVEAQLIEGPQGATGGLFGGRRPIDPARNTQSFDATFDFGGGFDHDPNGLRIDTGSDEREAAQWFASTAAAAVRYRSGSIRRSLEARGRGYVNYQSNVGDSILGGEAVVIGATRLGRRRLNELSVQLLSSYEPGWIYGSLSPGVGATPEDPGIGVALPQGIVEQQWLALAGGVTYRHRWNTKHTTTLQYDNRHVHQVNGGEIDGDWQHAMFDQAWLVGTGVSLVGGYQLEENRQRNAEVAEPTVRYQTLDGGLHVEKRISTTRRYDLIFRGGVTRLIGSLATANTRKVLPSLLVSGQFATSRFWNMSAEITRDAMVLAGVSPVPVLNDNINVTFNGTPTRKLRYSIATSVARANAATTDPSLDSVTAVAGVTGEVRYAMATWAAVFASYTFYHHRIRGEAVTATGFPSQYDRHAVRVGITLWAPLYGAF